MKKLYQCLDSIEICGNQLKCRFDLNNWHIMHNHDFWEIMVILEGSYNQLINGKHLLMPKHTTLLVRPCDTHRIEPGLPTDTHLNIVINQDFMREMCDFFDESLYERLLSAQSEPFHLTASQIQNLSNIARDLQLYPLNEQPRRLKRMLISFFLDLYQIQFDMKSVNYPDEFQKLFEALSHPDNIRLNVKDIVGLTGYSYSHFAKLFKSLTGISANEYLTKKKMEYASYALLKLNIPVTQLCFDLGFQSLGYFTNLFKKTYGVSPAQYKKLYHAKN